MAQFVYMRSPEGDEIKEGRGDAEKLTPFMVQGWHQVPTPADHKPAARPRRKSSMANINELMNGWGYGKQTAIEPPTW